MTVKKRQCRANRIAIIINRSHLLSKKFNLKPTYVESITIFYSPINTQFSFHPNRCTVSHLLWSIGILVHFPTNKLEITSVIVLSRATKANQNNILFPAIN